MSESTIGRTELIRHLRVAFCAPDSMTDDELLKTTEGAMLRAEIDLALRMKAAYQSLLDSMPSTLRRLFF